MTTLTDVPVVNFSASATNIIVGGTVNFTDLSTNSPTTWTWAFEGGTPAFSTNRNPSVVYNIPGTYSITLIAANNCGPSFEKIVSITVTVPQPVFNLK